MDNQDTKSIEGNKVVLIGVAVAAVIAVIAIAVVFINNVKSDNDLQKYLDLGNKYIDDMDYEQAIVAFDKAIEIDPMNVDAYIGKAEAYEGLGDLETALEVCKEGYNKTGDERFIENIDRIEDNIRLRLSSLSTSDENNNDFMEAINIMWSEDIPGRAMFYNPNEKAASWRLYLFMNDELFWSTGATVPKESDMFHDCYPYISSSGTYTFQVELFHDGAITDGYVSEISNPFEYVRPDKQLMVPSNIKWDDSGIVLWDKVENANIYEVELYYADNDSTFGYYSVADIITTDDPSYDLSDFITTEQPYFVKVRALSIDITKYANGEFSSLIPFNSVMMSNLENNRLDTQ